MAVQLCTDPTCYNYQRYCRLHQTLTFKPTTPIKKESDSRKEENKQYRLKAKQFLKRNPKCKICKAPATTVHHKAGRIGELLLDEKKWIALCLLCHERVTTDSEWAIQNGYSESRLNTNL
jgi:hypothetical protein